MFGDDFDDGFDKTNGFGEDYCSAGSSAAELLPTSPAGRLREASRAAALPDRSAGAVRWTGRRAQSFGAVR